MTTLRETIWKEIDLATRDKHINIKNQQQLTDEILKLVKKRIDYIHESKEEFDYEGSYHGDDEFWSGYELGFERAFEIIKKEL